MPGPFRAPTLKGNDKTDRLKKSCAVPFCDLMWAMRATKALKKSKFSQPYPVLRWWCGRKTWSSVATSWVVWDRRRGFKKGSVASFLIVNYQFGWKKQWWKQWWKGWKCCLGRRERSDQWNRWWRKWRWPPMKSWGEWTWMKLEAQNTDKRTRGQRPKLSLYCVGIGQRKRWHSSILLLSPTCSGTSDPIRTRRRSQNMMYFLRANFRVYYNFSGAKTLLFKLWLLCAKPKRDSLFSKYCSIWETKNRRNVYQDGGWKFFHWLLDQRF